MNATGESDIRLYYDLIKATQEARLRRPLTQVFDVMWQSTLGGEPPDTFNFDFNSLRQLDEKEKSELAERDAAHDRVAARRGHHLDHDRAQELKQSSIIPAGSPTSPKRTSRTSKQAPPPWEPPDPATMGGMPGDDAWGTWAPGGGPPGLVAKPPTGRWCWRCAWGRQTEAARRRRAQCGAQQGTIGGGKSDSDDSVPRSAAYWRRERA